MNTTIINLVGFIAGAITVSSQLPQLMKVLKTKSAEDLSLGMYLMLFAGSSLWTGYGFFIKAPPVIIPNILMITFITVIIFFKIKYKKTALAD